MIFRQFFDPVSCTYTYVLGDEVGREACLIDPVLDRVDEYAQWIDGQGFRLVYAIDTHIHADHITGLGQLRERTACRTAMGEKSPAECVDVKLSEGESLTIGSLLLKVLYTPGHTDDSYSYVMADRVFTGDALLIRGTGRTDFQNGDAYQAYDSLFHKLLLLPEATAVYPAHDYHGQTVSTIGDEKRLNPRLQVRSAGEYADLMASLRLPDPRLMDVAVPANRRCGQVASPDGAGRSG
jgi:glyoxylase-like metal-dependent hydrolase (beta-lactamase superfamily II)